MSTPRGIAAALLLLLLGGCRIAPPPPAPAIAPAPNTPADTYKEAQGWKPAQPSEAALRGSWWQIFGDPQLNTLESQAEIASQDVKAAEARFRGARAMVRVNRAAEFPSVSVAPSVDTVRESANAPYAPASPAATGDLVLPFDASWEIDIWGRIRRQVAAARQEAQANAADLESVRLIVHAEIAYDYFELRSAEARKKLLDQTVDDYRQALQLTTTRFEEGAAPKSDVAQARTQLDSAAVADSDITIQRAQYEHAIAVLIGKPPAEFTLPETARLCVPPGIPAGLPSGLLERRPDIAAAERRVAEANEQIGIAHTAFYPDLSLDALAGLEGHSITTWFAWPARFWAVGPGMAETLFDAGRRHAISSAAVAGYDESVAVYRQTVLTAFQQVEDNLAVLRILEHEAQQQNQATVSAQETLDLVSNRYREGADPYLEVLTAQTAALENESNDIDIARRRMDATVLLIKALGGGWTAASLPRAAYLR